MLALVLAFLLVPKPAKRLVAAQSRNYALDRQSVVSKEAGGETNGWISHSFSYTHEMGFGR
jgi:hypothetical protein